MVWLKNLKWHIVNTNFPETTFTLKDLKTWSYSGVSLAVIGDPIDHSLSPKLHNHYLWEKAEEDPQFSEWHYYRFQIKESELEEALYYFNKHAFKGINLTMPLKVRVLDYLVELDLSAEAIGACNVLNLESSGHYKGYNTDAPGVSFAVKEDLNTSLNHQSLMILGAGGSASAVLFQALEEGCQDIWLGNRSQERLDKLRSQFSSHQLRDRVRFFTFDALPQDFPREGLWINTIPLKSEAEIPINLALMDPELLIMDLNYGVWKSPLLRAAASFGMMHCDGLAMLQSQAALSMSIWMDQKIDIQGYSDSLLC